MFHIKQLELVHWDFWRRFTLPLDAQIITIVGPNGSGKTTLLDALRTLFALRCSGKRDFRRYVRRGDHDYAWIRAIVANVASGTGKRPFFPCMHDEVTLACRIKRAGGDWTRDYAILDGNVAIETLESGGDWTGLRDYQNRLAWGGLTPAIAKVLSLEQGDTDKLCEYSPRALLDLVFDVFGDKEVLDNYQAAREEQKGAERELEGIGVDLERLRAQAEAKRLEADNYRQWKQHADEVLALETEIVPRLEVAELTRDRSNERGDLARLRDDLRWLGREQSLLATRLAAVTGEREAAVAALAEVRADEQQAEARQLAAHDALRDVERLLEEERKLRERVASEHGADALTLEAEHTAAEALAAKLAGDERLLVAQLEEKAEQLRAARERRGAPGDAEVSAFRAKLDEAGIAHCVLSDVVEVTDATWQAALEAVLRPYRHLVLLEHEDDRHIAWELGEQARFRHFIVAERETIMSARAGSLAEVVRFAAAVPRWLADLLSRMQRVDGADAARHLPRDTEWITRDGYHRERRGARHLGRPAEFHFGELARQARIDQLARDIAELDAARRALSPELDRARESVTAVRARLLGLQSASLLALRSSDFAQARAALPGVRSGSDQTGTARDAARREVERLRENLTGIDTEIDRRRRELSAIGTRLRDLTQQLTPRRTEQAQRLVALRARRRGMPVHWLDPRELAQLTERYGDTRAARRELGRLRDLLASGDWVTDPSVLALRDRLKDDLARREQDYASRQGYCVTARRHTDDARAAYIAKLRATVRQYGKNLRALGDLASVGVDCGAPPLDNDDLALAQAGLDVSFDFDRKGAVGLNDGEASGGQQVMKSLILLIALLMDDTRPGGFVFIDEPFAHLDVANIDRVGRFLSATRAQYLITTPVTHNANVFAPSQLTLVTSKKSPIETWAPPIAILKRAK
jgi:chromosome segregation protein